MTIKMGEIKMEKKLEEYVTFLEKEERSRRTIEKYLRDIRQFLIYMETVPKWEKEAVVDYRERLETSYAVASVNSMLVAINGFLKFTGRSECCVKTCKMQRQQFRKEQKELSKEEYYLLLQEAERQQNVRLKMIMQTICSTGIRIGELNDITVRAVKEGRANVKNKGKSRVVLLPKPLRGVLNGYCEMMGIRSGCIFITENGKPVNRSNVWKEMKKLCRTANVEEEKVFPHNLRHLFARTYYLQEKDISHLADLLGHSSIETTRIYTRTSGYEEEEKIASLGLIIL